MVYSSVKMTAGQNSWFLVIDTKFFGKLRPLSPVSSPQLLSDIWPTSSSGVTNRTTTKTRVGIA